MMGDRFRHHQSIGPNGQIRSIQTLELPVAAAVDEETARAAGRLYWQFLRRFGAPVLRIVESTDGGAGGASSGAVAVGLPGLPLLAFRPPLLLPAPGGGLALRYPIDRGLTVDPRHHGEGYLQMTVAPSHVSLTVEGYFPNLIRLHTRIYEWTQAAIHLRVARGYLPLLAASLAPEANPFDRR